MSHRNHFSAFQFAPNGGTRSKRQNKLTLVKKTDHFFSFSTYAPIGRTFCPWYPACPGAQNRGLDSQRQRPNTFLNRKSALRSGILFASTELMHRPRSDSPLHFDRWLRTHTKFVRKNKMLSLGVCFPQPCSSARFAASRSNLKYYGPNYSFPQRPLWWMLCKLDSTANTHVRSNNIQPCLMRAEILRFHNPRHAQILRIAEHHRNEQAGPVCPFLFQVLKIFLWTDCAAGKTYQRKCAADKIFLTESYWVLCPLDVVRKSLFTNHRSESSFFN